MNLPISIPWKSLHICFTFKSELKFVFLLSLKVFHTTETKCHSSFKGVIQLFFQLLKSLCKNTLKNSGEGYGLRLQLFFHFMFTFRGWGVVVVVQYFSQCFSLINYNSAFFPQSQRSSQFFSASQKRLRQSFKLLYSEVITCFFQVFVFVVQHQYKCCKKAIKSC